MVSAATTYGKLASTLARLSPALEASANRLPYRFAARRPEPGYWPGRGAAAFSFLVSGTLAPVCRRPGGPLLGSWRSPLHDCAQCAGTGLSLCAAVRQPGQLRVERRATAHHLRCRRHHRRHPDTTARDCEGACIGSQAGSDIADASAGSHLRGDQRWRGRL